MGAVLRVALLALVVAGGLSSHAGAEHEVFYRYVVLGYARDTRGAPVAKVPVELVRDKTGFSYLAETGADGFYLVIARLGDESVGERLTLRLGQVSTRITARFDPANHAEHRGTRVDLQGTSFQERPHASFATTLARFLEAAPP
jgi:hypothetical protein